MTVSNRTPLGSTQLARDYWLDVNIGTTVSPSWIGVFGLMEFNPNQTPTTQDSSDFDSAGYGDEDVTAIKWGLSGKLKRGVQAADATQYDPGQEVLRLAANQLGNGNRVEVRWYEMPGGSIGASGPHVEAYQGFVNVQWNPDGGAQDALRTVSFTLGGKGKRNSITHPQTGQALATVTSLNPATATATTGGNLIIASGTGFLSVTIVTVFGNVVPVADWETISDSQLAFKAPAHAAGTGNVTVTNPAGTSTTGAGNQIVYA
jgi:hypothetical protein